VKSARRTEKAGSDIINPAAVATVDAQKNDY
jgi:hypothetical protein